MKSPTHLLNQCLQCGTKFDSSEQLANHVKKFCAGSIYGDTDKLEKRYQEQMRLKNSGQVPELDTFKPNPSKADLAPKNYEQEFKKQYDVAIQGRELEMQSELDRLKKEKAEIRLRKQKEEENLSDLMKEIELKKERDLRARIEKEQIKKEIILLEKNKLTSLEQEKKAHLEKLAGEREMLKKKEDHLLNELSKLENDMRGLEEIRQQEMDKVNKNAELLKQKGRENYGVNEILLRERSDKIAELKVRREQLDMERQRIMGDLEKVKKGETVQKRNNYGLYAANQMLNDMNNMKNYGIGDARDKFQREEERINQLRRDQYDMVQKEHIYPDEFASPPTLVNNNQNELTMRRSFQNLGNQIVGTRNNLDDKRGTLDEIAKLKERYSMGGGNDPNVIQNFRKMEEFYKQRHTNNNPLISLDSEANREYLDLINKKEQENKKLRDQIELMKLKDEKSPDNNISNPLALGDMNLRMHGINNQQVFPMGMNAGQDTFSLYKQTKEFFVQNEIRSVDLSEEERTLASLVAQEVDALRILSQIPIGTEIYRFKMDQYKELSTTRAEIEKIVQEQRLQKLRREFEKKRREEDRKYDNEKWVDDQRKNIIAARLRKDMQPIKFEQKYDPTEGFIIHWDYCLGVPKRNDSCQIVYGIYINGDEVYAPRLIDPHPCEIDTSITNRCLFGESHHILDIPSNSNALLVFEVQIFPNKDSPSPKLVSYGWTQLDMFDTRRELRRGKFKVPLYECPTDTNIDIEGIKYLNPVQNGVSWLYLRISYPNNDEYAKTQSIYPENTHMEYVIPQIHLRSFRPPIETQFVRPQPEYMPPQRIPQQQPIQQQIPYQEPYYPQDNQDPQDEMVYEPPQHQTLNFPEPTAMKKPTRVPDQKNNTLNQQSVNQTQLDNGKKGLAITIHSIKNHVAKSHLKVACCLFEENSPAVDETGNYCAFNTTVHNPLDQLRKDLSTVSGKSGMSNKAQGQDIVFKEDHRFLKDVRRTLAKTKGDKNMYLNFQILEKPEPQSIQYNNQSVSYRHSNNSDMANFGGMEYDLFGWYLFKINKDNTINTGKFVRRLLAPPLISPPVDLTKLKTIEIGEGGESYGPEIEFSVEEFAYDNEDVNLAWGGNDDTRKSTKKGDKKGKKGAKGDTSSIQKKPDQSTTKITEEIQLDGRPYIPNIKPQFQDKTFEKGMGIDFYVDGCRFLPDNVTVVRVAVVIVNIDFDVQHEPESNLPDFESPTYNPAFNFKMELRSPYFSPTALAFLSIDTVDKASNTVKIVGYSETDISNDLERLPTASILVRIRRAELSKDGLRVLGKNDFNPKEWEKAGVMIPSPKYATGVYNNSLCPIRDSEKELFKLRQTRDDRPIRESAQLLLGAMNINKELNDDELFKFLLKLIQRNSNTGLIDLLYFARYRQEAGFKFSLDGLHNVPKENFYVGLYMLNPPGGLYAENVDKRSVYLNSLLDWEGPLMSPKFLDDYVTFQNVKFDKNVHIILDFRTVNLSKYPPQFTTVGWGLFPIFTPDGFVKSGIYQVPLIKGEITDDIARDFLRKIDSDPWTSLMDEMKKNKKLKWLETTSAMVRLVDSQREGHFKNSWDYNRVIYDYLPKNKLQQYAYNNTADAKAKAGKKLVSIVPNRGNPQAFNRKITDSFVQNLELPQYQNDES